MERIAIQQKIGMWFAQYRYVILVVALGILLMVIPSKSDPEDTVELPEQQPSTVSVNKELEEILSQIHGVGKVRVMVTEATGAETVYQTDIDRSESGGTVNNQEDTVVVSARDSDTGLIRTVTPPTYLGAIIVCQGGENPAVRLAVSQAVSAVTGISTDRITVLKMK